ncbi:MAG: hypothetical protein HFH12_07025 [Dorea sp.]|nr:hypothetical protein [Dorea sp.]
MRGYEKWKLSVLETGVIYLSVKMSKGIWSDMKRCTICLDFKCCVWVVDKVPG